MSLNLGLGATIVNVVCAYAPQTRCTEDEKDTFWEEIDQELRITPATEWINGLITYSSGGRESQIDLLLYKRHHLTEVRNFKAITEETVAVQHRLVAKTEARRAVAKVKAETLKEVYEEMATPKGEKKILQIAMARDAASKDLTRIKQMKASKGIVLAEENEIKRRWETYFEGLLNEENPRTVFEDELPFEAVTKGVTRREVEQAVKKMKNSKAAGPDNIPVEVWKSLGEEGIDILWNLMQRIYAKDLQSGKDARGKEKKPNHPHIYGNRSDPGMWQLKRHKVDKPY
ncbi:uncharacterized protein [Palaemon carinicauda]|uniref:uncharacterized protein n=1 Tax=Palaemon carinicauda TaxID=392227 RepID=UPI0035B5891B